MKVVIAPDKFKGSIDAYSVCQTIQKGIHDFNHKIKTVLHPLADGGDGSLEILKKHFFLKSKKMVVKDPLLREITTYYLTDGKQAFIEIAKVSGLILLKKEEQNCFYTSSYGIGEMILDAYRSGIKKIYLLLGGSATCDAGIGMAAALGYKFFSRSSFSKTKVASRLMETKELIGKNLGLIERIEKSRINFDAINIEVVCDVNNFFYGKYGAATIFAPQKGANQKQVKILDQGLKSINRIFKRDFNRDISRLKSGGSAGGVGGAATVFLNARIRSGIEFFLKKTNFAKTVSDAKIIISGEGQFDEQSKQGKVISGIVQFIQTLEKPPLLIIICGQNKIKKKQINKMNIHRIYSLVDYSKDVNQAIFRPIPIIRQLSYKAINDLSQTLN